jgi:hypothetical protein
MLLWIKRDIRQRLAAGLSVANDFTELAAINKTLAAVTIFETEMFPE